MLDSQCRLQVSTINTSYSVHCTVILSFPVVFVACVSSMQSPQSTEFSLVQTQVRYFVGQSQTKCVCVTVLTGAVGT